MDPLIADQHVILGRMSRTCDNIRKSGKAKITKALIEVNLKNLDSRWNEFQTNDTSIRRIATEATLKNDYFTLDVFCSGEDIYCLQRSELMEWREEFESSRRSVTNDTSQSILCPPEEQARTSETAANAPASTPLAATPAPIQVRVAQSALPKANLPTFTGDYTQWIRFRDLFTTLVLNDKSWSDAERFHYLSSSLSGEAAQLIQRVPISSRNFARAWELLEHRYENRRLLIDAQLDQFYNLKDIRSHTAGELKRILNQTCNASSALNSLDIAVDDSSIWMVRYVVRLFDDQTMKQWVRSLGSRTHPPLLSDLFEFLERSIQTMEAVELQHVTRRPPPRVTASKVKSHYTSTGSTPTPRQASCLLCQGRHPLYFCQAFKGKSAQERLQWVSSERLCRNCLGRHDHTSCRVSKTCHVCSQPHHTMLHEALRASEASNITSLITSTDYAHQPTSILLATALISVAVRGRTRIVRALIDPCSEVTLISESLVQALKAPRKSCSHVIVGAGATPTSTVRGKTSVSISPRHQANTSHIVEALVLPRLTAYRPLIHTGQNSWPHLSGLTLADPDLSKNYAIDVLLGADVYPKILLDGIRRGGHSVPVAQETIFGWILSGPISTSASPSTRTHSHACTVDDLTSLVRRFWEQEEVPVPNAHLTKEEAACDDHYTRTHTRDSSGRYVVRLFFRTPPLDLGETHNIARRILVANERRFQTNPLLHASYCDFMSEYRELGHMVPIPEHQWIPSRPHFYLPHHGVMKVTASSTKIRVVFNGSKTSSLGTSLNAHLSAGPKLQLDLMDVLLRWRRHKLAFIADIEKMYRQIKVHPEDWDMQRILWRDAPDQPIIPHYLTTVTYGMTCAPYLAIRTLRQLAEDERENFPNGAAILENEIYVDDILSGADDLTEALSRQNDIISICKRGGFTLRKWNANCTNLLANLPQDCLSTPTAIPWLPTLGCTALGLLWYPDVDELRFSFSPSAVPTKVTKRLILSEIAKLFDPLGWLAPVTIRGKILMQQLWKNQLEWDENIPSSEEKTWKDFNSDMTSLPEIRIPRWIGTTTAQASRQLHAFVDASEKAYAAAMYLRIGDLIHPANVSLLVAKSKTAPVKTISLPRLELCAAVLGARLLVHVQREINLPIHSIHLWSDSTVALAWLRGEPARWNTYVANRVSELQRSVPEVRLHHVNTNDNPADCASRGIASSDLKDHTLWWHGPDWLTGPTHTWDKAPPPVITTEEEKRTATSLLISKAVVPPLFLRFSSYNRLKRITAWCLRWRKIIPSETSALTLLPEELNNAEEHLIKLAQHCDFDDVRTILAHQRSMNRSHRLKPLAPFLDERGILRVGGRLKHSLLSYDEQHPYILSPESPLTRLIIDEYHQRTLHGGVQLTLASLRHRFWIPQGRRLVKTCISRCVVCLRWRAATKEQQMGDLPPTRVTPARPFLHAGVDYAGPFPIRTTAGRGHKSTKGYIAIFVCFSTRAVHIEAVNDYTTAAFLAAFRRFTSRRGLCSTLSSDCGTNFVGADQELRRMFSASSKEARTIAAELSRNSVRWKFIPPAAPHFGGLWEAAVKSVKHHLRRVLGDATLTFEELATLLCQIEACLNSRPLQALTDDPDDLNPLTPGHFLIGEPLLAIPEPTLHDIAPTRLSRWQQQQQRVEHFWRRWSSEYLHQLQTRRKWTTTQPTVTVGDLVLVKSELTPPCKWPLARITQVHPGSDGLIRVVTVKTATTSLKRAITKIVPLNQASD